MKMADEITLTSQIAKRCKELSKWRDKHNEVAYQKVGAWEELKFWLAKVSELETKYYKLRYGKKLMSEIMEKERIDGNG